jgi:hypothetical protein
VALNVLVSMMSAPASRYWVDLSTIPVLLEEEAGGCLEIFAFHRETAFRDNRPQKICALDHRAHGAIEHDDGWRRSVSGMKIGRHDCS